MYIDASCLAAYYLPEEKSDEVQQFIRSSEFVSISYLTEIEMLSAIRKKQRMNEISEKDGAEAYQLFREHIRNRLFELVELSPSVFKAAEFVMQNSELPIRTLDAIHLGVVYEYKMTLYTFDDILMQAAKEFKMKMI